MSMTSQIVQEALSHPIVKGGKHPKAGIAKAGEAKVAQYAERISANWHSSTASIMKVADDCYSAREELCTSEKHDLIKRLPFGESVFSKLASIGGDKRLKANQTLLSPSISTIDLIRKHEQFELAKAEKVLGLTRDQVKEWIQTKATRPVQRPISTSELPLALYCIYPKQLLDAEQHAKAWSAVLEMAESQGLEAAHFTGENIIGQLKAHFTKTAVAP